MKKKVENKKYEKYDGTIIIDDDFSTKILD